MTDTSGDIFQQALHSLEGVARRYPDGIPRHYLRRTERCVAVLLLDENAPCGKVVPSQLSEEVRELLTGLFEKGLNRSLWQQEIFNLNGMVQSFSLEQFSEQRKLEDCEFLVFLAEPSQYLKECPAVSLNEDIRLENGQRVYFAPDISAMMGIVEVKKAFWKSVKLFFERKE